MTQSHEDLIDQQQARLESEMQHRRILEADLAAARKQHDLEERARENAERDAEEMARREAAALASDHVTAYSMANIPMAHMATMDQEHDLSDMRSQLATAEHELAATRIKSEGDTLRMKELQSQLEMQQEYAEQYSTAMLELQDKSDQIQRLQKELSVAQVQAQEAALQIEELQEQTEMLQESQRIWKDKYHKGKHAASEVRRLLAEKDRLAAESALTAGRLERAEKLTSGLAAEGVRCKD